MSHVVEHVHDPIRLLQETHRLLKPDGLLMACTPNTTGALHQRFGVHWFHLDPPRHLMLFNSCALAKVAQRAGFKNIAVTSTLRLNLLTKSQSLRIRDAGYSDFFLPARNVWRGRLKTLALQMRLWFALLLGDELLLEARK